MNNQDDNPQISGSSSISKELETQNLKSGDEFASSSNHDRSYDQFSSHNDSADNVRFTGEEFDESTAPGRPINSLLTLNRSDSTPTFNLTLADDVIGDDGDRRSGEENIDDSADIDGQHRRGHRPSLEHQCSKIAEIVEHAGPSSSTSRESDDANVPSTTISDETALAAGAWNLASRSNSALSTTSTTATEEEFSPSAYIRQRLKHVFILSNAGKPIYSRYGNEEELSSLMGVMQALVSFVVSRNHDGADELISIRAGSWTCVFVHRSPLILVAASRSADSYAQLQQLLFAVHQQIFSILTSAQLTKIFESRTNFDLRRLLTGTEKSFQNLITLTETNASLFLNAVKIHPMTASVRDSLGQAISHYAGKMKNSLVFAIVVANDQLVTIARMKRYPLHPSDLHLIINLVAANPSFKNGETFAPLCLPIFDKTGFLHAHISYLSDDCRACLLLLTVDRTAFFTLSDVKKKIIEKLDKSKTLPLLSECVVRRNSFRLNEVGVNDLWHFLYKNQSGHQFTCPQFDPPYTESAAQKRLFATYLRVHHRMHTSGHPLKILFTSGGSEAVLGWVTSSFELYAVFAPLTPKTVAIAKVDRLMKWLKKEENQLFIMNPPLY